MKKIPFYFLMLWSFLNFAQTKTITGKVRNNDDFLPGAIITIKGTNNRFVTNFGGSFSIIAKEGDILEVSYPSYKNVSKIIGNDIVYNFLLLPHDIDIEKTDWTENHKELFKKSPEANIALNGIILDKKIIEKIPEKKIKAIEHTNSIEAIKKYNELGVNGVINITTKKLSEKELNLLYKLYAPSFEKNKESKMEGFSGKVTDCEGSSLKKVEVINLNTKISTSTKSNGEYSFEAQENDVICFKIKDYIEERVLFKNQKKINISLKYNSLEKIIIAYKPIIYLYPTQKTDIELNVSFNGKILTTFPKLDSGWQVTAYENGQLFDKKTNRFYSSLFWDGSMTFPLEHYNYKEGFVVEKENLTL